MKNKKAYTKPEFYMEEFGVSQSIATCDKKTNTFYKDTGCYLESSDDFDQTIYYFNTDIVNTRCKTPITSADGDKECYHIPQSYAAYFGS